MSLLVQARCEGKGGAESKSPIESDSQDGHMHARMRACTRNLMMLEHVRWKCH